MTVTSELDEPGARVDQLMVVARSVGVPMAVLVVTGAAMSIAVGRIVVSGIGGAIDRLDVSTVGYFAAARNHAFDVLAAVPSALTDASVVIVLWVVAVLGSLWLTREFTLPSFIAFVVGGENLTYLITTLVVARPRPPFEALGHSLTAGSFPSGHVGAAVSLYGAFVVGYLWYRTNHGRAVGRSAVVVWSVGMVVLVVSVGVSRVYSAQHHPSDVVWGAVLGAAWLLAGWRFVLASEQEGLGGGSNRGEALRARPHPHPRRPDNDRRAHRQRHARPGC